MRRSGFEGRSCSPPTSLPTLARYAISRTWFHRFAAFLLLVPLVACSATSSVRHSPAELTPVDSTRMVDGSADVVWRRLVSRLPSAGFTDIEIDNAAKVARVSWTTDKPADYADCGRTERVFEGAWGDTETFEYEPAGNASYKLVNFDGVALEATRDVKLGAVATISAKSSPPMTEVSVDVSYDLGIMTGYSEIGLFGSASDDAEFARQEFRFETRQPGIGDQEVAYCRSNGKLEAQILELAT